jgi:nitrogen fixation NifU-like protein
VYSQTVLDHFLNPRNVGELPNPDAIGKAKNQVDGDQVQLHLRLSNGVISEIRMKVMGCVAAIAATSCLTELIQGKSVQEAKSLTRENLIQALDGLPENKIRCSLTCIEALKQALSK